jgi:hypothetical protein
MDSPKPALALTTLNDVWVRGKQLVESGDLTTVDVSEVSQRAQTSTEEFFEGRRVFLRETLGTRSVLEASN